MGVPTALLIVVATIGLTEVVATLVHRHVMHGFGWGWHRSHHEPRAGRFEKNDLYAVAFAALACALIVADGDRRGLSYWIGIGMTAYGVLYFFVHDWVTHRRWPWRRVPRRGYLKRLVQAHRLHHAAPERDGAVSFGFLYAPPVRLLKAQLDARRKAPRRDRQPDAGRQTLVGLGLAALVFAAWLGLHVHGVFFFSLSPLGAGAAWQATLLVAALTWLDVGLFIVAHDCMHGSLAPGRGRLNRAVGRAALLLYAGFSFDRLLPKHHAHHRHAGTKGDPDFDPSEPHRFWPWYARFFREYFGWREFAVLAALPWGYVLLLGAPWANLLLFWALPAVLSSLQLFAFGTWLPHRRGAEPFVDRHRARSNDYGWLASLLTCFHFGYHHEHHRHPGVPWWRLPRMRPTR